jgi:hypothetical protein
MKITVRQLKQLIREATNEAIEEMSDDVHEKSMYEGEENAKDRKDEEPMMEAVKAAYRAGLRKGRSVRR